MENSLNDNNKGKLLGIDFGEKNVGLAVTDVSRQFVFGRGRIENYKSLKELFVQFQQICDSENVVGVVFGVPLNENMEETERAKEYRQIASELREFLKTTQGNEMKVYFQDEAFSTFEGGETIDDPNLKKKYNSHELAAMVILERFIQA